MEPATSNRKRQIITTLAVLIVLAVIVGGVSALTGKDNTDTASTTSPTTTSTDTPNDNSSANTVDTASFKDGTYTGVGTYTCPGGFEKLTITVTLKDGVITETSAKPGFDNSESQQHQSDFIAAYKDLVVGKNISGLSLSRVAGASLTTQGFNNAIDKIKTQAQV